MGIKERLELHNACAVKVQAKGPHWGLYCDNPKCKKTGTWIQWISQQSFKGLLKGK